MGGGGDDEGDLQPESREEGVSLGLATRATSETSTAKVQTRSEGGDCNIEDTKGAIAPGHRHWAKQITSGSGARARTRKFAVGMEDVVLKRDLRKRNSG